MRARGYSAHRLTAALRLIRSVRAVPSPVAERHERHAPRPVVTPQRRRAALVRRRRRWSRGRTAGGGGGGGGAGPLVGAVEAVDGRVAAELFTDALRVVALELVLLAPRHLSVRLAGYKRGGGSPLLSQNNRYTLDTLPS